MVIFALAGASAISLFIIGVCYSSIIRGGFFMVQSTLNNLGERNVWVKVKATKITHTKKLRRNQETVSSQVTEKNLINVFASVLLKLLLLSFFGLVIIFPFIFMINISLLTDDEAESLKRTFKFASDFTVGKTYFIQSGTDATGGFSIRPWAEVVQNTYQSICNIRLLTIINGYII
ncbi:hypothetical protein [Mycoplasmopsis cynos]|uniref:hypothetical protein n=1 Tax=Mycoplasmopsis cynos TaxID=171284 RepID=UPI0022079A7F|nr:hypothetical protein [Mycoplasmopsis cynos]UWV77369.1 hypothetical protein NW070_06845 [Mycoplasmopsis cynos]